MSSTPEPHATAFARQFGAEHFPAALLDKYIPLELLSENEQSETYLLKSKPDGGMAVARRCASDSRLPEADILPRLSHPGLAGFSGKYEMDGHVFLVREYIPGVPLGEYAQRPLPEYDALDIAKQLCSILTYLHSQKPPVIHRDIKPSNIIINPEMRRATLIDFDIAREYTAGAGSDTVFMGTHGFSPPEQYGFSQTDCRADIYALGVVLAWMLSGRSDLSAALTMVRAAALRRIIVRCTAFDPKKRYRSAMQLYRAINAYGSRIKGRVIGASAAVFAAVLLIFSGYAAGRFTDINVPAVDGLFINSQPVVFDNALLEARVRTAMNRPDGAITVADAEAVTELDLSNESPGAPENERLTEIGALVRFTNLRSLMLDWNNVDDISPLSGLTQLETLHLNGNEDIQDFSPLKGLTGMKDIMLVGCPITGVNVQACDGMTSLVSFWVESTQLHDISIVGRFTDLERLVLLNCRIRDISPLKQLKHLTYADLKQNPIEDLTPLLELPYLGTVKLSEELRPLAEAQLAGARFDIVYE